ncbi:hypothetical protein SAMN05216207_103742 [Pseudonocardia ammonioxydans]|uniref:Uncharacterized protein n=1 Tax=Pseudonocardia ammonioxydans TaxID=260086 RepID=A0A1I5FG63_PSUAM|nr:hypothetical protein SAMN05216207_103742 [Pseudonocardia ammonioxydans]
MPSSLIFVGLIVLWLLILVPTVARRQQEVRRLSPALLSGRVLERPMRHRYPEVDLMERSAPSTVGELVEVRDDVPDPRDRGDDGYDRYDEFDAEIDDDGRVHGLDDDDDDDGDDGDDGFDDRAAAERAASGRAVDGPGTGRNGRERDPRPAAGAGGDAEAAAVADGDSEAGPDDRLDGRFDDYREPDDHEADAYELEDLDEADEFAGDELRGDELGDDERRDDEFEADGLADDDEPADDEPGRSAARHDPADELEPEEEWDHPPARYRPGRGGFDPEAAAAAAHAKYAFRQRVVLALLVLLVAAGATALLVSTLFWWVAGALGLGLVGYLTYLRRQVRIEESIRARRAARLSGRRAPVDDDAEAEFGPEQSGDEDEDEDGEHDGSVHDDSEHDGSVHGDDRATGRTSAGRGDAAAEHAEDEVDWTADDGEPTRVRGTGEPLGVLPGRRRTVDGPASTEHESSLPRLVAAPPPPVPAGTTLVDVDAEEEPDVLEDLTPHRRAVGE